jgi:hypothetical protein
MKNAAAHRKSVLVCTPSVFRNIIQGVHTSGRLRPSVHPLGVSAKLIAFVLISLRITLSLWQWTEDGPFTICQCFLASFINF